MCQSICRSLSTRYILAHRITANCYSKLTVTGDPWRMRYKILTLTRALGERRHQPGPGLIHNSQTTATFK